MKNTIKTFALFLTAGAMLASCDSYPVSYTHLDVYKRQEVSPQTVNYHIGQALKVLGVALKDYLPLIALFFEMPGNN